MNLLSKYTLKVNGYFEFLSNQINKLAEHAIAREPENKASVAILCNLRDEILNEIRQVAHFNINRLETKKVDTLRELDEESLNETLFERFCFLIESKDVNSKNKENEKESLESTFGYLIVTDKYVTREEFFYFKELLKYVNADEHIPFDNHFFTFVARNVRIW
jgi:hypothetical protein